ncbi:MAG: glycosyltransferase family 2 protein [Candidatus Hydrothermia bacterium]
MTELPFASLVVPIRNEIKFLDKLIDSLLNQDYPRDKMEVIFVDGESDDGTYERLLELTRNYAFIKVLKNPYRTTPFGMNIGVKASKGEYILMINAHSTYPTDYVRKNIEYALKSGADNVGGILRTIPANDSKKARAIAIALSSPFGVGNSYYRIGVSEPKYVDVVPNGCYKREVFEKIGFYDEDLTRAQDFEFNARLIKSGGKILLVPEICSYYYAREDLKKLSRMMFYYGYFKVLASLKLRRIFTIRQIIPPLFVIYLVFTFLGSLFSRFLFVLFIGALLFHLLAGLIFGMMAEPGDIQVLLRLPFVFLVMHISYGAGYLAGVMDFVLRKKHLKEKDKLLMIPTAR